MPRRLLFVVESSTDVRLVEGLADRFDLQVLARPPSDGVAISQPLRRAVAVEVGPGGRLAFARRSWAAVRRPGAPLDGVLVQGYGLVALAANLAARTRRLPSRMLVCSPAEAYYRCRRVEPVADRPFRAWELWAIQILGRLNRWFGQGYVVLSHHLASVVASHGRAARPVDVVPVYGVDLEVFRPSALPRSELRARLGLPATGALLLFSSRIAPEKDAGTLLTALRGLLDGGRDVWLLHRSGGHRAFLDAAGRAGVAERVVATDARDPRDGLAADYQAADLCVQASRAEGLGFSALEALACGTPVVASSVGGLIETIRDGETGWTCPPGDPVALASAIAEALDDPAEASRRAEAGRALVAEGFASDTVFDRLAEVLGAP